MRDIFSRISPLLISVGLMLSGPRALAHAHLEKAEPANGAIVTSLPEAVVLHFSEELEPAMSRIEVRDLTSNQVVSEGKAIPGANQDGRTLQVRLSAASKDAASVRKYEVKWKAVSKDTHKMKGAYRFTWQPKPDIH